MDHLRQPIEIILLDYLSFQSTILNLLINPDMFSRQFKAIMSKNWIINKRSKEYLRQNIAVVILSIFIIISEKNSPNSFTTPFYLGIAIAGYSRAIAVWWITQKQTHQKQLQKIMGVSQFNYIITWLIYFIANGLLVSTVMMLIVRFAIVSDRTVYAEGYGFWNLAILYFLYTISNVGFVLVLCTFFSKAKTGTQATTFIQLIINFLYFLRFSGSLTSSQPFTIFLSIFPQLCFNMSISNIAFIQDQIPTNFDFGFEQAVITFIVTSIAYILLALYLDQVIPNQLGTHRHPLFFIGVGQKSPQQELKQHLISSEENQNQSSAKYEQKVKRQAQPVARIINVSKSFKEKKVIENLSINFYESQIFCLLGHNGAGKSTTINLLTGLLSSNSGVIEVLGRTYPNDTDQIRKDIGLCLQYNVLYDNLTIQEHLQYYYRIKNESDINLANEVNRIIDQCALNNQRGKLAQNLSGGNKRKLCLANSLIGGSRLIFLDQPSSGLDPNSRQSIWDILKTIESQNRCIILTTHHLQQAQELSKRIAIMSQGKLIIVGSREFITDKFSVGYHVVITLNKNNNRSADICRQIVRKNIKRSVQDQQSAANTIKFIFPLKQLPFFSKTLKELEEAQIGQISIFMSNLEDAFIKIGEQEEQLSEGFKEIGLQTNEIINLSAKQDQSTKLSSQELKLPQVVCAYSFSSQMHAVFIRKMRTTLRSFSTVISIIMPAAFMSIGVVVVCVAIPNTETDPVQRVILDRIRLFIMSYFMVWAFVFNTSSYCGNIVLQREKRFKYISNVSGLRQLPYWAGNYAFDLVIFYIPLVVFFIITFALGDSGKFITKFAGYLIIGLILFGFSFIGYSYLFSFIFQKSTTAFRFFPFLNLIFFYFLPLIPQTVNNNEGILAQYLMPLLSPFVAFSIIFNTTQIVGSEQGQTTPFSKLWVSYLSFIIQAIVYFLACIYLERLRFSLKNSNQQVQLQNQIVSSAYQMDQQIREHLNQRISQNINYPIRIQNLTKIYGNGYLAVRNNSIVVKQGQIFGLLGPNGAGKSTTFNIMTAALPKTSGSVKLFNQQVNKGIMDIFSHVGVCPQYNPIYENMTVFEHLEYFCYLKGIPSQQIQSTINFYVQLLSLGPYKNIKAGVLSGGNKRKMCVGMAMIGNPEVVFFDEPSAGVDPISRRYLWKCLAVSAKSKNTAMVLTTHSMNQAESLCSQIGILIKGQFVCLDTPKRLKQKYGQGYRINVYAAVQLQQQLIGLVKRCFGQDVQVQRIETNPQFLVFIIKNSNFCLSKAFELFEDELTRKGRIKRYEIKQSTLQQVFIHLSKLQPIVQQQQYVQPWQLLCWQWGTNGCQINV